MTDIKSMPAGRELDWLMAQQLGMDEKLFNFGYEADNYHFSSSWECMRLVVEHLQNKGILTQIHTGSKYNSCILTNGMGGIITDVHDKESAPHAVSIAALLALGVEEIG